MPPYIDDAITMPRATYTIAAEDLANAVDDTRTGGFVHTTMTAPRTVAEPVFRAYTTDHITINETPWTIPKFVTTDDFEHFSRKIYKIIEEHTFIDISEEEFMRLIKDED